MVKDFDIVINPSQVNTNILLPFSLDPKKMYVATEYFYRTDDAHVDRRRNYTTWSDVKIPGKVVKFNIENLNNNNQFYLSVMSDDVTPIKEIRIKLSIWTYNTNKQSLLKYKDGDKHRRRLNRTVFNQSRGVAFFHNKHTRQIEPRQYGRELMFDYANPYSS